MKILERTVKGQSAIEYLTTYGWMLLVLAIVGGAIFTTVQDSSQIHSTSGLANADVQIENFGVTNKSLEAELRAASAQQIENANISLIDEETGETAYASKEVSIPIGGIKTVNFPNVSNSENTNTYNVKITYDTGKLENLQVEGTITGQIQIKSKNKNNDNNTPTAKFSTNTTTLTTGETIKVNASNSKDPDGTIDSYEWDWTNNGTYDTTGKTATHNYTTTGNKTIKLKVTDNDGSSTETTKEVSVEQGFTQVYYESFEDQPADSGAPEGWTTNSVESDDTIEVSTNYSPDGSQSFLFEDSGSGCMEASYSLKSYSEIGKISWNTIPSGAGNHLTLFGDNGYLGVRFGKTGNMSVRNSPYYNSSIDHAGDNMSIQFYNFRDNGSKATFNYSWGGGSNSVDVTFNSNITTIDSVSVGECNDRTYYDNISVSVKN